MKNSKIRYIVVDDEAKILENIIKKIKENDREFELVGKAQNGLQGFDLVEKLRPQVIFTDISMPELNGIELIKKIKASYPNIHVVLITGYSDFAYTQQAIRYGAFSYLLKPLEQEQLQEVLRDLKQSIQLSQLQEGRNMIFSHNYRLEQTDKVKYQMAMVGIGNNIYLSEDDRAIQYYSHELQSIPWKKIMKEICNPGEEWFITDDHMVNQKIVTIKCIENDFFSDKKKWVLLYEALGRHVSFPIHIYGIRNLLTHEEVWDKVKDLRDAMRTTLIVGKSDIYYLQEMQGEDKHLIDMLKMKLQQSVKEYLASGNEELLYEDIKTVFKYMRIHKFTQRNVEKVCIYTVKLLEISGQNEDKTGVDSLEQELFYIISTCVDEETFYREIIKRIRRMIYSKSESEELDVDIVAYVDANYLTIESVEKVAEYFGYNYAYFSRLFKQKTGYSMNQYVTKKKLEMAKNLMNQETNMTLQEIANMCGYLDYRYFSRVFKAEEGLSPSDYMKKLN